MNKVRTEEEVAKKTDVVSVKALEGSRLIWQRYLGSKCSIEPKVALSLDEQIIVSAFKRLCQDSGYSISDSNGDPKTRYNSKSTHAALVL